MDSCSFPANEEWKTVLDLVGCALQFVHSKGFLHNDLKGDNVLLERRDSHFNPVIIDFRKSTRIGEARNQRRFRSTEKQRKYRQKYPHVAPEIVTGTGVRSIAIFIPVIFIPLQN
ncbi:hypothetical protein OS493_004458 [Desmophyllum pertusum]|uniref:Protein kinase domain-containing protein n=1 Tax=Desmophyllum pertusum TaxID=174260 RepID=A0A9W9ZGG2_9CNID|nr:hypothetical protein OS493_004458 [Desmophyllum pertusum]